MPCCINIIFLRYFANFLAVTYTKKIGRYCSNFKGTKVISNIGKAKLRCDQDINCGGFSHKCGTENDFRLCSVPITESPSRCGSVLYLKGNVKSLFL